MILYLIISIVYFFELNFLFINEEEVSEKKLTNKEEIHLMKFVDFNNTFYREKNKIKFLYNAFETFE